MNYILFEIGPLTVYSYGFMIAVGIVAAIWTADTRAKKYGLDGDHMYGLAHLGLLFGFTGSKLLFFITEIKDIMENPKMMLSLSEGFVVYGGIIGGIFGAFVYCRWKKLPVLKYFDIAIASLALAQGFGRIGCFMAGCCYGRETDAWYGVTFESSPFAPNNTALIPTQIISSAANFVHFFILVWITKNKKTDGIVVSAYVILYSVGRFFIEMLRNDPRGNVSFLSTSQFISVFMLAAGVLSMLVLKKKSFKTEE